uniref:Uncharacterized protein n=1 Tax=Globisporangium ultimum (strain ATCC 200006 / CBS 805.95 / DAOM BR144) TaxID=431595 RepID=K3XAX7_GLOUD
MILQLQEYHERVQSACHSTYQFPLQPPASRSKSASTEKDSAKPPSRRGYCRAHVLETNKQFFLRRKPTPSSPFATPANAKDKTLPKPRDACVNFHQMTPRKDEFLFGNLRPPSRTRDHDGKHAMSGGIAKDHFALGPGQYDVVSIRPKTTTCVKFSPSDRFHDNFSTDQLGPGQYLTNDELTTRKAAVAVFSQTPRQTEAALHVSPTANVVSSYYYVPASSFLDKNAPQNDHPNWPRTPRLASQRHTIASVRAEQSRQKHCQQKIDYMEKNKIQVDQHRAVQRIRSARRRHLQGKSMARGDHDDDLGDEAAMSNELTLTAFKRRSSIFLDVSRQPIVPLSDLQNHSAKSALMRKASGNGVCSNASAFSSSTATTTAVAATKSVHENERSHHTLRGWVTLACIASVSMQFARLYQLVTLLRQVRAVEQRHVQQLVLTEWRRLDHARSVAYAKHVIFKNSFCLRFQLRIRQKAAHVSILRRFLSGLSIDVQFAVAMKKIKRKIMVIQHWWRHVQLMVRAREEALYHKWINVETRLRLEYINQMPHLQRIFHPPSGSSTAGVAHVPGRSHATSASALEMTLHKLLNLPDQKKWFTGRFVLTSDGCLRGYNSGNSGDADSGAKELVVEVKNFRCHFHNAGSGDRDDDFASLFDPTASSALHGNAHEASSAPLQVYHNYSNARWKPFLMAFRQGAFRFVLLTSSSPMPTEILSWKDKLERIGVAPGSGRVGGSISGPATAAGSSSSLLIVSDAGNEQYPSHGSSGGSYSSVGDFVQVSMQSGIHAPHSESSTLLLPMTPEGSLNSLASAGSFSLASGSSSHLATTSSTITSAHNPAAPRPGRLQARMKSMRNRTRMGMTVAEGELNYYVVDLLKDFPKVPVTLIWQTIREKLREKRKSFRAELYRYNLELFHFHRHQEQIKHIDVLDKFKEFFVRFVAAAVR